jgi:transglutaminase-like putative cysteine protease
VVFAVTAVWTLLVHTLRAEAIEAGEPGAAQRVLSRQLFATICTASLATVAIAIAIFPILPRVRSGAFLAGSYAGGLGLSGFSDRVELGDLGRIRHDPQIALRIDTLDGPAPAPESGYWRGLAFDYFDGRSWAVTPPAREVVPGSSEMGLAVGSHRRGERLIQRIVREPVASGVLFAAGKSLRLRGAVGRVERDPNGGLYALPTASERVSYEVTSTLEIPADRTLRADRAAPPREGGERYLQLPALSPAIAEHARAAVGETSPIESFLLQRTEGHCEYFATAMVVLARSVGLPARLVNGFAGGETNAILGFTELRQSDAHTWVEVHYEHAGWVPYDPTPPDLRLAGANALSAGDRFAALQSAMEFWWFRNVIDFDRSRQAAALRQLWLSWRAWRAPREDAQSESPSPRSDGPSLPLGPLAWLALPVAVSALGAFLAHRRRAAGRAAVPRYYQQALRLVARRGSRRAPADTARDFAARIAGALPGEPARAFARVTELYLAERFGGRAARADADQALRRLRDSLRA